MSKTFEREYKEYLNAQAPDLWDRIEKEIDALPVSEKSPVSGTTAASEPQAAKVIPMGRTGRGPLHYYRLIASVAACLVALCLIVPVYRRSSNKGEYAVATDSAAEECAEVKTEEVSEAAPKMEMAVAEEECDMAFEEEAIAESEELKEETVAVVEEVPMEMGEEDTSVEMKDGTDHALESAEEEKNQSTGLASENPAAGKTQNEEMAAEEKNSDLEVEEVCMSVTIPEGATQIPEGTLYEAVLVGSTKSSTIPLLLPSDLDLILETNTIYTITAQKQPDTGYYLITDARPE